LNENYLRGKEKALNDLSLLFKEKEKGSEGRLKVWWPMEGSMLGGQWKVPCLVANGRFHAWWPMEGSMLNGQWKVTCLVANGLFQAWWPMEGEGKTPFMTHSQVPCGTHLKVQLCRVVESWDLGPILDFQH